MKEKRRKVLKKLATAGIAYVCLPGCVTTSRNHLNLDQEWTIQRLHQGYQSEEFTIEQIVAYYLQRIKDIDQAGPTVNSILYPNPNVMDQARAMDKTPFQTEQWLYGVPIVLKDNIDTFDMPTTAGSLALQDTYPSEDSAVAAQLRSAGAIILGKANLSEWANFRGRNSTSGWSGLGGQTKNPYILNRNPCGSSSGSGVSVAANLCVLAIGTETNGSIICPAQTNGIVGIKPTVGLVSRSGIIPISYSQDTAGPMARTVQDAAICLNAIIGYDSQDGKMKPKKSLRNTNFASFCKKEGLHNKRVGVYRSSMGYSEAVDQLVEDAILVITSLGAEVVDIEESIDQSVSGDSFQVMLYEYKAGLNDYFKSRGSSVKINTLQDVISFNNKTEDELRHFGQEYLIMANEKGDLESQEYKKSLRQVNRKAKKKYLSIMSSNNIDAFIGPSGSPAWLTDWENGDTYLGGSGSAAAIAGYPNITVPMGYIDNLPVGISFFGKPWTEGLLIGMAYAYELATKHRKPPRYLTS